MPSAPPLKLLGKKWYTYYSIGTGRTRKKKWVKLDYDYDRSLTLAINLRLLKTHQSDWAKFKEKYLEYSRTNKVAKSLQRDRTILLHLENLVDPKRLSDLTSHALEAYKSARKAKNAKESTINRELGVLKNVAKKAFEWGFLHSNPWARVEKFEEDLPHLIGYTKDQEKALFKACSDPYESVMEGLGMKAGLRRGEMLNLKWTDIDFKNGTLSVVSGGGRRTKNRKTRHIPLSKKLALDMAKLKKYIPGQDYVLSLGWVPSGAYLTRLHTKVAKNAQVGGNLHKTRHTFGTRLVEKAVHTRVIQELMGHSTIAMTERYTKGLDESKEEAIKRLG